MSDTSIAKTSSLILLSGIVVQPLETFHEILEHSRVRWVLPFQLCITGHFIVTVALAPLISELVEQEEQ